MKRILNKKINASFKWPLISDDIRVTVKRLLRTGTSLSVWTTKEQKELLLPLEESFAQIHDQNFAIAMNSGTSAIYSMLKGINIKLGDEIIVPAWSFHAAASPIMNTGAKPVIIDSSHKEPASISPELIEKELQKDRQLPNPKIKAILVVHMSGIPNDMEAIAKIAKKYNVKLLEDCSQAFGASVNGKLVGTFGDAAAWSLGGKKLVSAGEGGMFTTNDKDIYQRALLTSYYTQRPRDRLTDSDALFPYRVTGLGMNFRISALGAAIALSNLKISDQFLKYKRKYARQIIEALEEYDFLTLPNLNKVDEAGWYNLPIVFNENNAGISRSSFVEKLKREGLKEINFPTYTRPLNLEPLFRNGNAASPGMYNDYSARNNRQGDCPVAEKYFRELVRMPVWATKGDQKTVDFYIAKIRKVCDKIVNSQITKDTSNTFEKSADQLSHIMKQDHKKKFKAHKELMAEVHDSVANEGWIHRIKGGSKSAEPQAEAAITR